MKKVKTRLQQGYQWFALMIAGVLTSSPAFAQNSKLITEIQAQLTDTGSLFYVCLSVAFWAIFCYEVFTNAPKIIQQSDTVKSVLAILASLFLALFWDDMIIEVLKLLTSAG